MAFGCQFLTRKDVVLLAECKAVLSRPWTATKRSKNVRRKPFSGYLFSVAFSGWSGILQSASREIDALRSWHTMTPGQGLLGQWPMFAEWGFSLKATTTS